MEGELPNLMNCVTAEVFCSSKIWLKCGAWLLLGAMFSACSVDHRQTDIKKCIAKAGTGVMRQDGQDEEEVHDAIGASVAECMKGLGYRYQTTDAKCVDDVDFGAYCYVPRR